MFPTSAVFIFSSVALGAPRSRRSESAAGAGAAVPDDDDDAEADIVAAVPVDVASAGALSKCKLGMITGDIFVFAWGSEECV